MIVALDGGLNHLVPGVHPQLVVSGVNLGPNLSQDSYHSGTMGATGGGPLRCTGHRRFVHVL